MGTEFERQPLDTAVAPTFWNQIPAGKRTKTDFPETAPAAQAVFFRTYSRHGTSGRETWEQVCDRTINGLKKLGQLDEEETARVVKMMRQLKSLPSGRWLWVGGVEWLETCENFSGAYNCTSTNVVDWRAFGLMMDLAMMGCGTGAVIVQDYINQLPPIRNRLQVKLEGKIGSTPARQRRELTEIKIEGNQVYLYVGDSRHGWVKSYQTLLELAADEKFAGVVEVIVNLADVRPAGEVLKGFGGVANPVKLPGLYQRCANILNKAVGRQLNSVECCLLIDGAAVTIVSGNIRRCLPEDALVHTAQGLVPIAKVRVGDRVLTSKGFYSVTNFFVQGEQSLCRIQTQDGFFECTADHKVAVFTDVYGNYKMVKAQDLQSGDRLVFVPQAIPGTPTELPEFRGKVGSKSKRITVPALTSDVAYFIGYLHGDGSVSSDGSRVRFRVHEDSPKILERLIAVGREFGLETYTLRPPQQCRTKAYELQFNSSALNQYLKSFKQAFQSLNVPDCILLGTVDIRKAYLAGLADADGCHSQGVLVGSIHQRFLQQVQTLYASLGITVRLGGSIRKRTGKWEGELVTVGGAAFKAVENNKSQYSIQFSTQKRQTPKSFRDHGFPKAMVRPIINTTQYHWGAIHQQMTLRNLYRVQSTPKMVPEATNLVPVKVLVVELNVRSAPTYDIEVATVHEFVCEGILVSNSAGMRQGGSEDQLFATAKENLWQQDEKGNWRIDPERDSLRMANHSRVFHHKPTLTECIEAVRKQYYSGEGAIQWAGEALARANCDLITTTEERTTFLKAYAAGEGKQWFQSQNRSMSPAELEHRLARFGLNPCHSGDTLVSTDQGLVPIKDLVEKPFKALVDLRSIGLDGVKLTNAIAFPTSVQTTYLVTLANGMQMRCTADHQHFTNQGWVATKDLVDVHAIYVQKGEGSLGQGTITVEQSQMLGWWYGDGYNVKIKARRGRKGHGRTSDHFAKRSSQRHRGTEFDTLFQFLSECRTDCHSQYSSAPPRLCAPKGFVFNSQEYETAYPVVSAAVKSITGKTYVTPLHKGVYEFRTQSPLLENFFAKLGIQDKNTLPTSFLRQSKEVLIGFLQGIFCADGTVEKHNRRIKLVNKSEQLLQQIQLILLQLGIISIVKCSRKKGYRGVSYTTSDGTQKVGCVTPSHPAGNAAVTINANASYADSGSFSLCVRSISFNTFGDIIGFPLVRAKQEQLEQWMEKPLLNYSSSTINSKFTSKVKSVEELGEEPVYDLHVPLAHSFIANGCVTHNCGEIIGSNFHCVSGDTLLITRDGMHHIRSLVGESVEIWNGKRWSPVVPILTGTNRKLYRVSFSDGTFLDVTEKHRFFVRNRFGKAYMEMTAGELRHRLADCKYALHTEPFKIDYLDGKFVDSIWAYTLGQLVGDGAICQSNGKPLSWCAFQPESDSRKWVPPQLQLRLYGAKSYQELAIAGRTSGQLRYYAENPETPCLLYTGFQDQFDANYVRNLKKDAQLLEDFAGWSREGILHFVAGLIDADGAATKSGGVRLYMSGYDRAYRIYLLLLKCGIRSSINLFARGGTATNLGIRQKDLWYIQITDCAAIPCQRVDTSGGHEPKFKGKWQIIRSVEPLKGEHDTFCFNEVEFHKGVFGGTLTGQCNLSEIHLNQIDPKNYREQEEAFTAGALAVASLLNHKFIEERYRYSREIDPIVGVSFTGLFDFFVHAFGVDWLRWWEEGRPDTVAGMDFKHTEQAYLNRWRETVEGVLWDYCHRHGLKRPNRCTTVQPAGCLDRTALRIFDQGLLYADEVVAPGSGETVGLDLSVRNGVATDTAIANQPLNLLRVTLKNGRVLRMTKNHRLSVEEKWVRADQLEIGMEIDYSLGQYRKQEDALLLSADPIQYTRVCRKELIGHSRGVLSKEILTPTTLNPDLGYFLGCLFGDGAMSEHKYRIRFSFNAQEFDLVERLQAIAQRCFGLTGSVNYDSRNHNSPAQARLGMSRGELVFACKQLFDWLNLNGLGKPTPQPTHPYPLPGGELGRGRRGWVGRIPQLIRQSSRETILSFFCGLIDTDGCVRKQGSLSIDSANEAFVRNLQQVGEAVGLCFSIFHNSQGNNLQGQKDMWDLCLSPMQSSKEALDYLNAQSRKCGLRPTPQPPSREGGYGGWVVFKPYQVVAIELETEPDYSYDFAVAGTDDNDSWYWQGALKSHNTKSLLTGASPGWHPPKAQRFIRRITFRKNDPVALACLDYGYKVVPSQSDKDEKGNLLNDPFDLRCTEWLVEIPTEVSWANIPGADTIDISKFSALAQMDFYMNVQRYYTRHNSSATIELREHEIEALGTRIYEAIRDDEGYISAALLARFDDHQTFPRLPFEPIDKETYVHMIEEVKLRRLTEDFHSALSRYDSGDWLEAGPAGCDSDKCLLPEQKP